MISVKPIPRELTYDIRHAVLREGLPRESCYWDTDTLPGAFHLGGWLEGRQAGVATFQPEADPDEPDVPAYRLRGMAVLPDARGCGVGALMLLSGEDRVRQTGITRLWCDARIGAVGFYRKHGWESVGEAYDIPTAGLHCRMKKKLAAAGCRAGEGDTV
ncbi:MAG: GNAT family N-acetyltransferase [Oscillospiraceae bacterium]|jgi:GNAT superfamily N-acetyltransferase|nr:GNAT family N-acetyltransferase [Oscillospiraceae bacterium]